MKRITLIITILVFALLAGCAKSKSGFGPYQHMTSAQIFHHGEMYLAKGDYDKAVKALEALDAIYPFGPNAEQGQLDIVYAYYKDGDTANALASADRYISLYPRSKHVDYAYYMKGLINFTTGLTWLQRKFKVDPSLRDLTSKKQAFMAFGDLVTMFPNSPYVPSAVAHMAYIRNLIANKNIVVGQYYFKRKAYLAAANRGSFVVQHFEGSPSVIPGLALMVKSYDKLGLHKLANDSLQILVASYPNSKQAQKLAHKHKLA